MNAFVRLPDAKEPDIHMSARSTVECPSLRLSANGDVRDKRQCYVTYLGRSEERLWESRQKSDGGDSAHSGGRYRYLCCTSYPAKQALWLSDRSLDL